MSIRPNSRSAAWLKEDLPGLFSLAVFFAATALIFRSLEFALIVTASLGFHELGHALMLARLGLDFRIGFGLVGAFTYSHRRQRARLSQFTNAAIHLAGPLLSLVLAFLALVLHYLWQPESSHLLVLANFSAQVGFLNLLPLGPMTDGGKVVRRMMRSLSTVPRTRAVFLPFFLTALMLVVYTLVERPDWLGEMAAPFLLGLLLVGVWLSASMFYEARLVGQGIELPANPMAARQVYLLTLFMWNLLLFSLVIMTVTPFWLTPDYALGPLQNMVAVLRWFFHLTG